MRSEVLEALAAQRAAPTAADGGGSTNEEDVAGFKFASLQGELAVAGVYVRIYNTQPNFGLADPQAFCKVRFTYLPPSLLI